VKSDKATVAILDAKTNVPLPFHYIIEHIEPQGKGDVVKSVKQVSGGFFVLLLVVFFSGKEKKQEIRTL
jgi:hypothetical protein